MRTDEKLQKTTADSEAWKPEDSTEYTVNDLLNTTVPPGFSFSGSERNHLFVSRDAEQFDDVSGVSGLDSTADSRSFAVFDFDRDGLQDVVVVNVSEPTLNLYRNESTNRTSSPDDAAVHAESSANMLAIRFRGGNTQSKTSSEYSARDGYGTMVQVQAGDRNLVRQLRCGEGFASQNSSTMIIGLDSHSTAKDLTVRWPSGVEQILPEAAAGTLITVYENPADSPTGEPFTSEPYSVEHSEPADRKPKDTVLPKLVLQSLETPDEVAEIRMYTTTATWCSACKTFLPQLERLRQSFDPTALAMYGVPVDPEDEDDELKRYIRDYHPAYEMVLGIAPEDRDSVDGLVLAKFSEAAPLPSTIITDRAGNVLLTTSGVPTLSEVRRLMAQGR